MYKYKLPFRSTGSDKVFPLYEYVRASLTVDDHQSSKKLN